MTKNPNYRQFLDNNIIQTLNIKQIEAALKNIKGKYQKEGRALLIALYYSGARPNEVLRLRAKDIYKKDTYICINVPSSKKGLPRTNFIPIRKPLIKELYTYAMSIFEEILLFYHYRGNYHRIRTTKKGKILEYNEISDKLRYHVYKWFKDVISDSINPYFIRHSRYSQMAMNDVSPEDIRIWKGSKSYDSVTPYIHMSSKVAKRTGSKIE